MPRFEVFEMRHLWINEQTRRHGKGRALGRLRQAGDTERTPERYLPLEDAAPGTVDSDGFWPPSDA